MEEKLSFDQLPALVATLSEKVNELSQILHNKLQPQPKEEESDKILSVDEAAAMLGLAKPTIYSKASRREFPSIKSGKFLYFSKNELMDYLMRGRRKATYEIANDVDAYLSSSRQNKAA